MNISISELVELSRPLLMRGGKVRFRVKGQSMWPLLRSNRDIVEIIRADNLRNGDIVLAGVGTHQYLLHRIICKNDDNLTLCGDGNLTAIEYCTTEDVIGKVVLIIRGTYRISTGGGVFYTIYMLICLYVVSPMKKILRCIIGLKKR